jgi:hypothetical protein
MSKSLPIDVLGDAGYQSAASGFRGRILSGEAMIGSASELRISQRGQKSRQ